MRTKTLNIRLLSGLILVAPPASEGVVSLLAFPDSFAIRASVFFHPENRDGKRQPQPDVAARNGVEAQQQPNQRTTGETAVLFHELTLKWKSEQRQSSLVVDRVSHPAYLRIIGLGRPALPLILGELEREVDHWFYALQAISGENPVPVEHYGRVAEMAADWLEWGRRNGYLS